MGVDGVVFIANNDMSIIQYPDLLQRDFNLLVGQAFFLTGPMRAAKTAYLNLLLEHFRKKMFQDEYLVYATKSAVDVRLHGHEPEGIDPKHIYTSLGGSIQKGVFSFNSTQELFERYEILTQLSIDQFGAPRLVLFFDEIQFADHNFPNLIDYIKSDANSVVIGAGLNIGFRNEPWSVMMEKYMDLTDKIIYLTATCEIKGEKCNEVSKITQRYTNGTPSHWAEPLEVVGGIDNYFPACDFCRDVPGKDITDAMRDIIRKNPDMSVAHLYTAMEKFSRQNEIRLILFRMHQESTVYIQDLIEGDLIKPLSEETGIVLTKNEQNSRIIEGGRVTYQGILNYR